MPINLEAELGHELHIKIHDEGVTEMQLLFQTFAIALNQEGVVCTLSV